ncbi:hypothetical protein NAEX_01582 [Nannocystis exedens]|nr:hypothetical protein NAEX_01582 [Nannocystis exedens]
MAFLPRRITAPARESSISSEKKSEFVAVSNGGAGPGAWKFGSAP